MSDGPFIKGGMRDWKHVHQRIVEHEKSKIHRDSADAYFLNVQKADVKSLLTGNQMSLRTEQVKQKRQVMERIVEVIKVIGKCGLSYRGDKEEAGYSLENLAINHGNVLELILLLSKYDVCLQQHVNSCIENSKKQHETGAKGRGSLITLLSKDTLNKVVDVISQLIKATIAEEVKQAGMFSVQIDTTQDISSKEQCSIILRYVTDVIHERLIAVVDCETTTGQHFAELLKKVLLSLDIDIGTCVGNSTDGAANMQGQYRGFSTLLSEQSPNQIHVWCYAHLLNLVLADTTGSVVESASLFSLLNDIAVFLRESYKRMQRWEEMSQDKHHRRLCPIGPTRWWAKDQALSKVFGCFGNPQGALFLEVLMTLNTIVDDKTQQPTVRAKAKGFIEGLLRYETVLTAQIFLRIFQHTSPLSKYLQTKGMDIITAQRLVKGTEEGLRECARDFEGVKCAADEFVKWANERLQEEEECELVVQTALPERRVRKKRKMPGELADDEQLASADTDFRVKVHNVIVDTVTDSINRRFSANAKLCSDFACLDPRNFACVKENGLPSSALEEISKCLLKFDNRATASTLCSELYSLACQLDRLKMSPLEGYTVRTASQMPQGSEEDPSMEQQDVELESKTCSSCKNCVICVHLILSQYNLLTDAYHVIGLAYKLLLTLSITQVACERSFSTVKFIKNRLRSSLTQRKLDAFMLMCTEKEIIMSLDNDTVINKVAETSALLRRLLLF